MHNHHEKSSPASLRCKQIILRTKKKTMTETCIYFSIPTHEEAVQMCDSGFWATSYRLLRLCVNLCAQARTVSLCEAGLYLYLLYRSRTGHELSLHCQTQMQHLYTVCLHPFCRHFMMLANIVRRLRHLTVRPCDDEQQIGNEGGEGWTMNGAFHASPPKPESLNGHVFSWTLWKPWTHFLFRPFFC